MGFEIVAHFPGYCRNVAIQGSWAYVAAGWNGVLILDLSDLSSIGEAGHMASPTFAWDIAVDGKVAFVAEHPNEEEHKDYPVGVQFVDVSDKMNPVEIGRYVVGDFVDDVCVHGHQLYVLANWHPEPFTGKLLVLSLNDIRNPTLFGQCDISRRGYQIAIADTYAYVAAFDGLHVIDITQSASPRELHHVGSDLSLHAFGVTVSGEYSYTAAYFQGLRILTTGAGAKPRCVSRTLVWGMANNVAVRDDVAYVADVWYGLWQLDVTDKAHPVETGCFLLNGTGFRNITLAGSLIFVSAERDGLYVLRDTVGYRDQNLLRRPGRVVYYDDNIEWL